MQNSNCCTIQIAWSLAATQIRAETNSFTQKHQFKSSTNNSKLQFAPHLNSRHRILLSFGAICENKLKKWSVHKNCHFQIVRTSSNEYVSHWKFKNQIAYVQSWRVKLKTSYLPPQSHFSLDPFKLKSKLQMSILNVWSWDNYPRANHLEPTTLLRQLSKSQLKNAIIEFVNSKAYN